MRINFQWPQATMFSISFVVLGVLVYLGKLHPEVLLAQMTWLAPSPLMPPPPPPPPAPKPSPEPEGDEEDKLTAP